MKIKADKFLEKFLAKSDFDIATTSAKSIRVIKRLKPNNQKVTFIFVPWQSGPVMQSWIMKAVPKNRDIYSISPVSLLLASPIETADQCLKVCEQALAEVNSVLSQKEYSHVGFVGLSVGTGVATYVANRLEKIDSIDLICPGAELSASLWLGSRTQKLRVRYEEQGFDLKQIKKMWSSVDLLNNLDFTKGIKVRLTYSGSDAVIVPEQAEKVVSKLKDLNPSKLKIRRNRFFGHYLTMFVSWLNWRTIYHSGEIK